MTAPEPHLRVVLQAAEAGRAVAGQAARAAALPGRTTSRARVDAAAAACRTTDCPLPAQGDHGRCRPCEAVYATAALLARRLASRHLARVEFELPGFEQAALRALGLRLGSEIERPCDQAVRPSPAGDLDMDLLAPRACEVDRIERLIPELRDAQLTEASP